MESMSGSGGTPCLANTSLTFSLVTNSRFTCCDWFTSHWTSLQPSCANILTLEQSKPSRAPNSTATLLVSPTVLIQWYRTMS